MTSELVKQALSPAVVAGMTRSLKGLGAGAGIGGLLGAGAGATLGGARAFRARRAEGGSVLEGIGAGLKGALPAAGKGALIGAAAGGAIGAARPAYAEALTPHFQGSSRFGQRQVQALTGIGDANYVRSI